MVIYWILYEYRGLPEGTSFIFVKSKQRFEAIGGKGFISNRESARNPGLLVIKEVKERRTKRKTWYFNF
jgi:hypothetical protein